MNTLVIDRSSAAPSFALFNDAQLLCSHHWKGEPTRAPEWIAEMGSLLAHHNIPLDAIGRFVCGLGPGSFSGIRACLAAVLGLALPGKTPVCGVASAAAIASALPEDLVTVVGDARRNRIWCVTYRKEKGMRRLCLSNGMTPTHTADDFHLVEAQHLPESVPHGSYIVSSDWIRLEPLLRSQFEEIRLFKQPIIVTAESIGELARADPQALTFEPSPIYLHPAV
jgi:tRNA threonylcarbamoyl adenosine modification protein YeaZ